MTDHTLYRATPSAGCLRARPHYSKTFIVHPTKPFSFEVYGPVARVSGFPYERGASMLATKFVAPGLVFNFVVGIYFFDTASHADAFYKRVEAPYRKTFGKLNSDFALHQNVVLEWEVDGPSERKYERIVLGCLRRGY